MENFKDRYSTVIHYPHLVPFRREVLPLYSFTTFGKAKDPMFFYYVRGCIAFAKSLFLLSNSLFLTKPHFIFIIFKNFNKWTSEKLLRWSIRSILISENVMEDVKVPVF